MKNAIIGKEKGMILVLMVLLFMVQPVIALGLSVSAQSINIELLQGESAQREFFIGNPSKEAETIWIGVGEGECSSWLSFSEDSLEVPSKTKKRITAYVNVPDDVNPGKYKCNIDVGVLPGDESGEGSSMGVGVSTSIGVEISVTGVERVDTYIHSFSVSRDDTNDKLNFKLSYVNTGNSQVKPDKLDIAIKEGTGEGGEVVKNIETTDLPTAIPGEKQDVTLDIDASTLDSGSYTAVATLEVTKQLRLIGTKQFNVFHDIFKERLSLDQGSDTIVQREVIIERGGVTGNLVVIITIIMSVFLIAIAIIVKKGMGQTIREVYIREPARRNYRQTGNTRNYPDYYNKQRKK